MDRKENDSMGLPFVEWQRKKPVYADRVCIDKLQFSTDVFPDAFGRDKAQPGLISIALSLREQFQSAAQTDALDQSTINYGTLSKAILKSIKQRSASGELIMMEQIWSLIGDLIPSESVEAVEIDIFLPKACMVGDGIGFKKSMTRGGYDSLVIYFKNIRTSTIIGVNAHERKLKQPVIANVWLDDPKEEISIPEHVRIVERILIEVRETRHYIYRNLDSP